MPSLNEQEMQTLRLIVIQFEQDRQLWNSSTYGWASIGLISTQQARPIIKRIEGSGFLERVQWMHPGEGGVSFKIKSAAVDYIRDADAQLEKPKPKQDYTIEAKEWLTGHPIIGRIIGVVAAVVFVGGLIGAIFKFF